MTAVQEKANARPQGNLWPNYRDGCPIDTVYEYYPNGRLKSIIPYSDCNRNGWRIELSINGDTLAKGNSNKGKSIGTHYAWWSKGRLKFRMNFNDSGQLHGLSEEWRQDGSRKDSIVYEFGEIIEARSYFENGKVRFHLKQKPGAQVFSAIYYDPSGKKTGEVKRGNGTYISYSPDGTTANRVKMEKGEVTSMVEIDVR